jgi:MFS family permease
MSNNVNKISKSTPLGAKIWLNAVFIGLIGQIAWVLENMYFATFAQNIFQDATRFVNKEYYIATTLMVIFSAVTATVTTIFAGGLCDRTGKRKPFVSIGYIVWGLTIFLFMLIPTSFDPSKSAGIIAMLVIFDCIMTVAGSTSNDAAFNTWVTDVTDFSNRGRLNTILSILPVLATVLVLVVAMFTFDKTDYTLFFGVLGAIPLTVGIISIFTMKDSKNIVKNKNPEYLKETFYGFRKSVAKENKMLYVTLSALCIIGISQQIFMSYLINFVSHTLGITDYLLPLAVIIVGAAAITGVMGFLYDKFGRKHFYIPLLAVVVIGTIVVYCMKFMSSESYVPLLMVGGIFMLGAMLCMSGALMSTFQDYIPKGYEGRFQGVRMTFTVLIPMIIGPIISLIIGINAFDAKDAVATAPPFEIFLAASIVAVLAFIPVFFIRKDSDSLRSALSAKKQAEAGSAAEETLLGEPKLVSEDKAE